MGTSNWQNISYNIDLVRKLDPKSILDLGVGFGRWGILFREFLEIWDAGKYGGNWDRTIDGVEIYVDYLHDYHKYFYNNIYVTDALTFLINTESKYDLINCGDVIEHLSKEDGKKLIKIALDKSKYLLINIPVGKYWEQNNEDNIFETHRSVWYKSDFKVYKYRCIKFFRDFMGRKYSVILLSNQKFNFKPRYGKYFNIKNFLKYRVGLKKIVDQYEFNKIK